MKLKKILKEAYLDDNDFINGNEIAKSNPKIAGWSVTNDFNGGLEWSKDGENPPSKILVGTPGQDEIGQVEFAWVDDGGRYHQLGSMDYRNKKFAGNKKLQLKDYLARVKNYIKRIDK